MQRGLKFLVEALHDYSSHNNGPEGIKLLVPQQYVAKIIGVGNLPLVMMRKAGT